MGDINNQNTPLVAIRCITYNQESYIRDALDGFVMQKTNFPFVAIVHDDASTDATADIIREYVEKYPDIIKPIYENENQYSKPGNPLGKIMQEAIEATGAKYVAMCEGDDYWTDPYKLQKQVDFLESHPEYSMCFHGADVKNESGLEFKYPNVVNKDYTSSELFDKWIVPTASIVYRISQIPYPKDNRFISGDIVRVLYNAKHGKIRGFSERMSVYRVQNNGLTISRLKHPIEHYKREYYHYKAIYEYFPEVMLNNVNKKLADTCINLGVSKLKRYKISGSMDILYAIILSPSRFINRLSNLIK